jgi:hypothetical protein
MYPQGRVQGAQLACTRKDRCWEETVVHNYPLLPETGGMERMEVREVKLPEVNFLHIGIFGPVKSKFGIGDGGVHF